MVTAHPRGIPGINHELIIFDEAQLLHDRSLSSVARDESRMTRDESRMAGDYCRPDKSIHRCVRTHSHLYSYIYGLVALLDNIQSSFSIITI